MTSGRISGVIPPVATALHPDGEVDVGSLENLVRSLLAAGVHGVFALGSAGEAAYLTDDQRRTVVRALARAVAGRVPVIAGTVDTTARRVIEQARAAVDDGADGVVVTAPFYARASAVETVRHFELVAAATSAPVYAYNIPVNVHSSLAADTVADLLNRQVVHGVKDSSRDIGWLRSVLTAMSATSSAAILVSAETLLDVSLDLGASGVVSGLVNVDPAGFVRLYESHIAGDRAAVADQQKRVGMLSRLYGGPAANLGGNALEVGAIKAALVQLGRIEHDTVSAPMTAVSDELRTFVHDVLASAGLTQRLADEGT